jgi:hypothetical protein
VYLKDYQEIHVFLSSTDTNALVDQVYSIFSGEFDDNCIEICSTDKDVSKETILLKANEVLYIRVQEDISDE